MNIYLGGSYLTRISHTKQLPDESPEVVLEVLVLDTQLLQLPPGGEQR